MKKMRNFWAVVFVAGLVVLSGCSRNEPGNSTVKADPVAANASGSGEPKTKPSTAKNASAAALSLATPTDAYNAAYEYRKTKNIDGLKKVMSKDVLEFLTEIGQMENKSLDDMLRELCDKPQAPTNETRNLKVSGDTATLEYPDENGTNWTTMDLIKEGNDWKMTIPTAPEKSTGGPKKP
jgi:hypothetical protein